MYEESIYQVEFIHLPDIVLEMILSNLTYDEIAKNRIVCRRINNVCKKLLNRGFHLLEKTLMRQLNAIKNQMPRRESEKKHHPLMQHYDILSSMNTRIELLSLTFYKYVDANLCCFFPGKILDETFRLLNLVKSSQTLPDCRNREILGEFRDLSDMAMQHFNEKILPAFKRNTFDFLFFEEKSPESSSNAFQQYSSLKDVETEDPSNNVCSENFSKQLNKIYNCLKKNNKGVYRIKGQVSEMNRKMNAKLSKQHVQIKQQDSKIQEYANKIKNQDEQLADMKEQLEDLNEKLKDLITASSSTNKSSKS